MQFTYSYISSRTLTKSHKKWSTIWKTKLNPKAECRVHMADTLKFKENPVLHAAKPYRCSAVATAGRNGSRLLWIRWSVQERPTQRLCRYNTRFGHFDFESFCMLNKTQLHEVRYDLTKNSTHLQKRHFVSATQAQNTAKLVLCKTEHKCWHRTRVKRWKKLKSL